MTWAIVLGIGTAIGALGGFGIFWVPQEPYKVQIFLATMLRSAPVSPAKVVFT